MKKISYIFAAVAILLCGCNNQVDMPQFSGLPDVELEADAYEAEIDDEALWEALQAAAMYEKATYLLDKDGNWERVIDKPTSAYDLIICIGDESYCYVNLMNEWCPPKIGPYAISYDADTNTLYSYDKDDKSKKYSAVVKYFDGENLILDGYFAPTHDRCDCCDDDSGRHLSCFALDKELREEVIDLL